MVAAMVTVRPELEKLAAFSVPTRTNVNEVVVTGPGAPPIASVDDLAGQEVFVRKGSIYEESLVRLNEQLKARGKPAVVIDEAPDVLEDDDVLEMVNAGLVPITVVDDYLAEFWSKVFTSITVHSGAPRSGAQPGRRVSQGEPQAPRDRQHVAQAPRATPSATPSNAAIWTASNARRTLQPMPSAEQAVAELFKKYGAEHNIDYLLMAAQGYQESTLDQDVKARWCDRRDAGHAADRQGVERRRHYQSRRQHPQA